MKVSILLDKTLPSAQQSTSVALIFLLCLHSCISNNNKNNNTNDNYSHLINSTKGARGHSPQLIVRRIENLDVNDYHLYSYSAKAIRDNSKCNMLLYSQFCLLSLTTPIQYSCKLQHLLHQAV